MHFNLHYSTIAQFYYIRAKERAKYATLLHCRTGQKYGLKRSDKLAAQNQPNFALFTSSDLDFLTDELFTEMDFLTEQTETNRQTNKQKWFLLCCLCLSRVLCNQYDARWISKTKSQNTRKWRNGGIINPLFNGLTYNTSGHFAHCLRNSQNICGYYMLNHRIRCIYKHICQTKKLHLIMRTCGCRNVMSFLEVCNKFEFHCICPL